MRKLLPLFIVLAFALAGCQGEGSEFAGKYTGTFTIIKNNTNKSGSVRITNDPLSLNGIRLYGVLPLTNTAANVYEAESENVDYIVQILTAMVGESNFIDSASEQVKNIKVKTTFNGNNLYMYVAYEVQLLNGLMTTEIRIIEFTGTK
ncbi:MAG: hypothetical protein J5730_00595 [Bacteroidales bacterium]|nr:hypothetical protein [Bacteroidales bacterium]